MRRVERGESFLVTRDGVALQIPLLTRNPRDFRGSDPRLTMVTVS